MFDFAKAYEKAVMTSHMTGVSPMDAVKAEQQASIMGIKKTGDFIEDYGSNVMLSSATNLSAEKLSEVERTEKIMFGK